MRLISILLLAVSLSACAIPQQDDSLTPPVSASDRASVEVAETGPANKPGASEIVNSGTENKTPATNSDTKIAETVMTSLENNDALVSANEINQIDGENVVTEEAAYDELFPRIDLWQRIRNKFSIPTQQDNRKLRRQIEWYASHPEYMLRVTQRAEPYLHFIVNEIEKNNVPMEIALLPIVESAFKPFAYSHGRAAGIWQFIPSTGRRYGLKQNWWYDGRRDIYASTQSAIKLLSNLAKTFDGDWLLALAAYNSGEGTVKRAIRKNKKRGKATDFWSLKLPPETSAYVPKLIALKRIVSDPAHYNIELTPIDDAPYFTKVDIPDQLDLAKVAELSEIDIEEVYTLNPAFNRWATSPAGPHYVLLPIEKAESFATKLAELPKQQRIKWIRHTIRSGETISAIASKYNTSISSIKKSTACAATFYARVTA